jgi:hypothetical protein
VNYDFVTPQTKKAARLGGLLRGSGPNQLSSESR